MNMQSKGFPPLSSSVVFCLAHISCSLSDCHMVWVSWDTNRTGFNTRQVKLWQQINHHTRNIIKEPEHRESNLIRSALNTNICSNAVAHSPHSRLHVWWGVHGSGPRQMKTQIFEHSFMRQNWNQQKAVTLELEKHIQQWPCRSRLDMLDK